MTGLEGDWKELGAGFELEQGLVGLRETEDGFDSGFGAGFELEQGLVGLGETENGFDSGFGAELGETGRDRASATMFSL